MPEGFMLYFGIDKANSLMDRFKFMGLGAAEPFPAVGSSSPPLQPGDVSGKTGGVWAILALQD